MEEKTILLVEGTIDTLLLDKIINRDIVEVMDIKLFKKKKHVGDHKKEIIQAMVDHYLGDFDTDIYGIVDRDNNNTNGLITASLDNRGVEGDQKNDVWNIVKDHLLVTDTRDLETLLLASQKDLYKIFNISKEEYRKAIFICRQLMIYREMLNGVRRKLKEIKIERNINRYDQIEMNFDDSKAGCIFCGFNDDEYYVDFDTLIDESFNGDKVVITLKSFCHYVIDNNYVFFMSKRDYERLMDTQREKKPNISIEKETRELKVSIENEYKDVLSFIGDKKEKNKYLKIFEDEYDSFDIDNLSQKELYELMRNIRGHDLLEVFEYLHRTILSKGDRGSEQSLIKKYDVNNFYSTYLGTQLIELGFIR